MWCGIVLMAWAVGCTNNPYRPGETAEDTYFSSFSTPPTKLDPATAYYVHEGQLIDQIYEPLFTYHYLKRPYELIPNTAEALPVAEYYGHDGARLQAGDPAPADVARVVYTVKLKRDILFQDHPCFALDDRGTPRYADVTPSDIRGFEYPSEFEHQGSRELTAHDYALQVRRLADPRLASPVFSVVSRYITGMAELNASYSTMIDDERARRREAVGAAYSQELDEKANPIRLDYGAPEFPGMVVVDSHTLRIELKRKYPQILFWMCMHFFGPVPQEALDFYAQPAMIDRQFTLNRCPVGTGPYFMDTFRPNEVIVLSRNPNFHADVYPSEGAPGDEEAGLLVDAGKALPFIDRQVLRLEKEAIPNWNKFLQGYIDASAIANDVFDQAVIVSAGEGSSLSPMMIERGIELLTDVDPTLWYTAFNMLDDVVGGYTEERAKLRQAISIVLDYNEFLEIFRNGRGVLSQGPVPPGIFGYRDGEAGTNPFVDAWDPVRQRHIRRPVEEARRLIAEAGYPGGRGPDGQPLTLNYDHSAGMDPSFRSYFDWVRNRLDLIGVRLKDQGTDLSRFRQKRKQGNWQVSSGGWLADYPDPENFLFLFYGPNGKVEHNGVNMVNYANETYDELFLKMESMANSPRRQELIDELMGIVQHDAPAVWQYHPVSYILRHRWYRNVKPHAMSYNTMKYRRIDSARRVQRQEQWNQPVYWPLLVLLGLIIAGVLPAALALRRQERS